MNGSSVRGEPGPLPTFLIIGAAKAGTTTLSDYLATFPDVFIPPRKEIHYFTKFPDRGDDWYREQFAAGAGARAIGEASPSYLFRLWAHERMAALLPDVKLVAIFRHPVDRAYSHYWYWRSLGEITASFEEMIDREINGRKGAFPLLAISRYMQQIDHLLQFYPRESLLVLLLDDLRADPDATTRQLCEFLGLAHVPMPEEEAKNVAMEFRSIRLFHLMRRWKAWGRLPFNLASKLDALNRKKLIYPPMTPTIRRTMLDNLALDNEAFARWLGRDLSDWSV